MLAKGWVRTPTGWGPPANTNRPVRPEGSAVNGAAGVGAQEDSGASAPWQEACREAPSCPLPHSELQELQEVGDEDAEGDAAEASVADYQPGVSGVDGESRGQFRIAVTLHVSDNKRRDPTGALETICDVITATRRRLGERLVGRFVARRKSKPRRRGLHDHANKDFLNPPF